MTLCRDVTHPFSERCHVIQKSSPLISDMTFHALRVPKNKKLALSNTHLSTYLIQHRTKATRWNSLEPWSFALLVIDNGQACVCRWVIVDGEAVKLNPTKSTRVCHVSDTFKTSVVGGVKWGLTHSLKSGRLWFNQGSSTWTRGRQCLHVWAHTAIQRGKVLLWLIIA